MEKRKTMNLLPFQMVASEEGTREEVMMPEYKQLLMFVSDTDQSKRS